MKNLSKCFISIYIASNRPENIKRFVKNLYNTADDINNFELLISIDKNDFTTLNAINYIKQKYPINIFYAESIHPHGYFSLNIGYNKLFSIANKISYFDWLLNDEIVILTQGWDSILKKYIKLYDDDIFRLRLSSQFKLKNYYDIYECMPSPDNYSIQTRKFMNTINGWGECWAPDPWVECIDYFLRKDDNFIDNSGVWRSIPIFDILLSGEEANQEQAEEITQSKIDNIASGWKKYTSHHYQEIYLKLASKLKAEILKYNLSFKHSNLSIKESSQNKQIFLYNNNQIIKTWNYNIAYIQIYFCEGFKKQLVKKIDNNKSFLLYNMANTPNNFKASNFYIFIKIKIIKLICKILKIRQLK